MEIAKTYDPAPVEDKWYAYWLKHKYFAARPNPGKEPYCIVIPPPNVTGVLHMGHMLNNTIQDILVRRARMQGREACWVPGTDHASIATEARVVAMLREKGIEKKDISREQFLAHALDWKEKYGGIILEQLKKLGASCDWDRTRFTLEPALSESVIDVFLDLHAKGRIYRAYRMVNWDPKGKTALSDEEVVYKEVPSKLYYIRYDGADPDGGSVVIATTRPETILADTAVCVHPDDERYRHLHGRRVRVPLAGRTVPVITDAYVTMEFGTGALKVTPAHDLNDHELGKKHGLPVIDILNDDGTLNEKAGVPEYTGRDRFAVRKQIAKDLQQAGFLEKVEDYRSNVGYSERNPDTVVEPKVSLQWWLRMDDLARPALAHVLDDTIRFHPPRFKNMYRSWMENVRDWCISRQLWWGHRIPAWYGPNGEYVVAKTHDQALALYKAQHPESEIRTLNQDEDVLDTWFSSWLWPISVFDGLNDPDNADIKYFYPTNDLVTAPEIIFFWVARMIMAGYEYRDAPPFRNVYFTGIVRDKQGRKMSKSLGNSPDPLELIARHGADGVRTGMLFSSQAGNDLMFDEKLCEQGRNFNNKIWNAFRLINGLAPGSPPNEASLPEKAREAVLPVQWFRSQFNRKLAEVEAHFAEYRISDALLAVYELAWDDFCSWYLEMVKPDFGETMPPGTYRHTVELFDQLLRVLHPFMPFITEEIWQQLQPRAEGESICTAPYPTPAPADGPLLDEGAVFQEVVSQLRNLRSSRGLSPKIALPLAVRTAHPAVYHRFGNLIQKLANVSEITFVTEKVPGAAAFMVKADEFFVTLAQEMDMEGEREKTHKELEYQRGFRDSVLKKLDNERFVANAKPEVVEAERRKLADAEAKIKALEERLGSL